MAEPEIALPRSAPASSIWCSVRSTPGARWRELAGPSGTTCSPTSSARQPDLMVAALPGHAGHPPVRRGAARHHRLPVGDRVLPQVAEQKKHSVVTRRKHTCHEWSRGSVTIV
jgi:hypothetical protein